MQTRRLGNTDVHLTKVGLGTWAIGGPWTWGWGPQDDDNSVKAIEEAIDLGINWIDTAPAYGLGHSEKIVGKAIKGKRDRLTIATKCGRVWDDPSDLKVYPRLTAESVRAEAEASLRRLDVEVIDLYQIHWPQPDEEIEDGWTEIAKLVEEGKIRYGGVSNFNVPQLERAMAIHPVASLQPPYSMVKREIESEVLPFCADNNIGVVPYSPMQAGLLTGAFSKERVRNLAEDDWRRGNEEFLAPKLGATLAMLDKLEPIARENGKNLAQLAIAWVLRRPEVTSAIVGARKPGQISGTAPAADWTLDDNTIRLIDGLLQEREQAIAASG